jgi:hypothetical protein
MKGTTDMSTRPGSLYRVCGRLYVDSQAVLCLADKHTVAQHQDGWRVLGDDGAVLCAAVVDRPALPRQRGALYELAPEGEVHIKERCKAWLDQGLIRPGGMFDTWPGLPAAACSRSCACAPCRARHGEAK